VVWGIELDLDEVEAFGVGGLDYASLLDSFGADGRVIEYRREFQGLVGKGWIEGQEQRAHFDRNFRKLRGVAGCIKVMLESAKIWRWSL
jgi:hypothetical protein